MKRSGGSRPFRTLGARMRAFGRSLMRHYAPPGETPPWDAPPTAPGWQSAAETPLVWPETPAPDVDDSTPAETDLFEPTGAPRPRPPQSAPPPSQPAPVQRKAAPKDSKIDPRLLNILAQHQEREAERQRIREEKKTAFDAAEVQRQADPNAPSRPRRGRLSVDYVETSTLKQGDDTPARPPKPTPPPAAPSEAPVAPADEAIVEDTAPLDTRAIQAKLAEDGIDWQPAPDPADDFHAPPADDAPDWDSDADDDAGGAPPRLDQPPLPFTPPGIAQRMPAEGDAFDEPDAGYFEMDSSPADPDVYQQAAASPARETRRPAPPNAVQRDDQPAAPDFVAEDAADYSDAPDDWEAAAPAFEADEGDTRPMPVQRAPLLPPPDFADDSPVAADSTYGTLADWMDAQPDSEATATPPAIQRAVQPPAPDVPGDATDFDLPDDGGAGVFDVDDGDTRPLASQPAYAPPASTWDDDGDAPPPDAADEPGYDEPESDEDVTTPPANSLQRQPAAPDADFDQAFAAVDAQWDGAAQPAYGDAIDAADADDEDYFVPPEPDIEVQGIAPVSAPPAKPVQRQAADLDEAFAPGDVELDGTAEPAYADETDPADQAYAADDEDYFVPSEPDIAVPGLAPVSAPPAHPLQRQAADLDEAFAPGDVELDGEAEPADANETDPVDEAYDADADDEDYFASSEPDVGAQGIAPVSTPPAHPLQRQTVAPDDTSDWVNEAAGETSPADDIGIFEEADAAPDDEVYDDPHEAAYGDFVPRAYPLDAPADTAQRNDLPPAMPQFYGDDVYQTDISALLGSQPDPRPVQRRAALSNGLSDLDDEATYAADEGVGDLQDAPGQPLDLFQAMMQSGLAQPARDDTDAYMMGASFDADGGDALPGSIQRAADEIAPSQPLDLFQAMMQSGMVQPAHDDDVPDGYELPPAAPVTGADLLDLLDSAPPPSREVSQSPGGEAVVSRAYEPPPPPVIQRVEDDESLGEGAGEDVNVDQLARDVYSLLRNRLRIERERRDRKP